MRHVMAYPIEEEITRWGANCVKLDIEGAEEGVLPAHRALHGDVPGEDRHARLSLRADAAGARGGAAGQHPLGAQGSTVGIRARAAVARNRRWSLLTALAVRA